MQEHIDAYGECPSDLSGRQALEAILQSDDLYVLGAKNLAPYDLALFKVAKSAVLPKPAAELLPQDSAIYLQAPEK